MAWICQGAAVSRPAEDRVGVSRGFRQSTASFAVDSAPGKLNLQLTGLGKLSRNVSTLHQASFMQNSVPAGCAGLQTAECCRSLATSTASRNNKSQGRDACNSLLLSAADWQAQGFNQVPPTEDSRQGTLVSQHERLCRTRNTPHTPHLPTPPWGCRGAR